MYNITHCRVSGSNPRVQALLTTSGAGPCEDKFVCYPANQRLEPDWLTTAHQAALEPSHNGLSVTSSKTFRWACKPQCQAYQGPLIPRKFVFLTSELGGKQSSPQVTRETSGKCLVLTGPPYSMVYCQGTSGSSFCAARAGSARPLAVPVENVGSSPSTYTTAHSCL